MKNNLITALALGALLCLHACWCKKQCRNEQPVAENSVTQVAIMEDIDAYNTELLVIDQDQVRVAQNDSSAAGSIKF